MSRRGIALLATLWSVAALSVVAAGAIAVAREGRLESVNRIALIRGRWGAEACLAVLQGRPEGPSLVAPIDSLDLGTGVWCRVTIEDPAGKIALDAGNGELLSALVAEPVQRAALLDWLDLDDAPRVNGAEDDWYRAAGRPLPRNGPAFSVDELLLVRGFDSTAVERLRPFVTARGGTQIDLNAAPLEVLLTIPGLEDAAPFIFARRASGWRPSGLDELLGALPTSLRRSAEGRYGELQGRLRFTPDRLLLHLEGHVAGCALVARTTVLVGTAGRRTAILAREEW